MTLTIDFPVPASDRVAQDDFPVPASARVAQDDFPVPASPDVAYQTSKRHLLTFCGCQRRFERCGVLRASMRGRFARRIEITQA